jgi:hypothetical protein
MLSGSGSGYCSSSGSCYQVLVQGFSSGSCYQVLGLVLVLVYVLCFWVFLGRFALGLAAEVEAGVSHVGRQRLADRIGASGHFWV